MTARSTRNKMRHQVEKIVNDLDRAVSHCKLLDEMAEGQSDLVSEFLPDIVQLLSYMKDVIKKFRESL